MRPRLTATALLFALPVLAQQQPVPEAGQNGTYSLHANARIVVLDVVVVDRKGQPVTNLRKDDFQVFEEKQPQSVTIFEPPATHPVPPVAEIHSTPDLDRLAPQSPVNIIVLDELNSRFEDEAFTRYSLKKYLSTQPDKLNAPTTLIAVSLHKFNVLVDYTQDKNAILSALEHHTPANPWQVGSRSWAGEQFSSAFSALMQVSEATAGHPGHKNMIWIGRGFPTLRLDKVPADQRDQLTAAIDNCVNMLRDSRVTLYTVDPRGVVTDTSTDEDGMDVEDPFGGNVQFSAAAAATGGKSFYGRNDVDAEIGTSIRDGASFYTLTYRPSSTDDARRPFRGIRVRVKDPNLHAITREGYYLPKAPEAPTKKVVAANLQRMLADLSAAAGTTLVYDGVPLRVERDASDPNIVHARFLPENSDWTDNGPAEKRTLKFQVVTVVFDKKNKPYGQEGKGITAQALPLTQNPKPANIDYKFPLPAAPAATRLRVVVRVESSGKIAAANFDLTGK
jgi:VWFA-related protein